ncbi:hypothetical protein BH09SUM1_BH09SUM1_11200 [soil metagenome]
MPPDAIIIVPCYNEEKRLPVGEFQRFATAREGVSFLFVNDGSRDGTARILDELCASAPGRFEALHLTQNVGKAEAVRQGFLRAFQRDPKFVGFWDADLATPLDEVPIFLNVIQSKPDIQMVIGARVQLLGRQIHRKLLRHYIGRIFATIASNYLRIEVYDTQCGAKLFRNSEALREIFATTWVGNWLFDVEILVRHLKRARKNPTVAPDYGIYELPLDKWEDVKGSKVKTSDFPRAFIELLRIVLHYR